MVTKFVQRPLGVADVAGILISVMAVFASLAVSSHVFESMAHLEDELAFVWQAEVIASGRLTLPSPPEPDKFLIPFVVDFQGNRFAKYPLGWPALLSFGVRINSRHLVNALLAGLGVWLTYGLGKRVFSERVGTLAAGLTLTSPFFLMNSGSLLSHPFGLVLSSAFAVSWFDTFLANQNPSQSGLPGWVPPITAGLALGTLILTRPLTAVGVAIPFVIHGAFLLVKGDRLLRQKLAGIVIIAVVFITIYSLWQFALSGDALLNPYTLWWPYDRVGFGPGAGVIEGGHTLTRAFSNAYYSLRSGISDLFGWGKYSWIFIPFGIFAARKNKAAILIGCVFPSLVVTYLFYWIGQWLFGPRYYYEGLYSLTILSAAGIIWLAKQLLNVKENSDRWRINFIVKHVLGISFITFLVMCNLRYYVPARLGGMYALYGISRQNLVPFDSEKAQSIVPALIFVHAQYWTEYGTLLELEDAYMTTPFVFLYGSSVESMDGIRDRFPDRQIYHYYPDEPFEFYDVPRGE